MAEQTMTKKKGLKKGWRIVLGILAGLILLYAVLGVLPRRENYALANPMMKEGALPLLIAHGGAAVLGQDIQRAEADIMPGIAVLAAGVAQPADDKFHRTMDRD